MAQSFTSRYPTLSNVLKNDINLSIGYDPNSGDKQPPLEPFVALWDTGATNCVIMQSVIDRCGLKPTGITMTHGVHGAAPAETYLVNFYLPNKVAIANVRVTKGSVVGADVLIGMDVIGTGSFAVSNYKGKTTFTFSVPSDKEIDFVQNDSYKNAMAQQLQNRAARKRAKHK